MALFVPTINSDHVQLGMIDSSDPNVAVDNKPYADLLNSGVLVRDPEPLSALANGGDLISVPANADPADFARIDHTSAVDLTTNVVSTNVDKAIVQYNKVVYEFQDSDKLRTGNDASLEYSRKVGGKIAKRLFEGLMKVAVGALDAVDTPSAGCHVLDVFSGTMGAEVYPTVDLLRQAKALLGDAGPRINTAIMHSTSFNWLLRDLMLNYGAGSVLGDEAARTGILGTLLNIRTWIISDLVPTTSGGSGNQAKYNIFLFGPGALWTKFQAEPKVELQSDILKPSTRHYQAVSFAAVMHLRWLATTLSANPTDAELITDSSYNEAYDDHRRVLAVKLVTNGIAETA